MRKRMLAVLLSVCMIITGLPIPVFAAEGEIPVNGLGDGEGQQGHTHVYGAWDYDRENEVFFRECAEDGEMERSDMPAIVADLAEEVTNAVDMEAAEAIVGEAYDSGQIGNGAASYLMNLVGAYTEMELEGVGCPDGDACQTHVAAIGDTHYDSLEDAVLAATSGQTIKMLNDTNTGDTKFTVTNKAITLDLNGKTITTEATQYFLTIGGAKAKVTIDDTSAEGSGKIAATGDYILRVTQGTLDMRAGTVESNGSWVSEDKLYGNTIILIKGYNMKNKADYSNVIVGEDVVLRSIAESGGQPVGKGYAVMVDVFRSNMPYAFGVNVDFSGKTEHACLYVNGAIKGTSGNIPAFHLRKEAFVEGGIYAAG